MSAVQPPPDVDLGLRQHASREVRNLRFLGKADIRGLEQLWSESTVTASVKPSAMMKLGRQTWPATNRGQRAEE